jgi:hypothetical protein
MRVEALAADLVDRLNRIGLTAYYAGKGRVIIKADEEARCSITVIDAGAGRTEQVLKALSAELSIPGLGIIVARRFTKRALEALEAADANYMDDGILRLKITQPPIFVRVQEQPPRKVIPPATSFQFCGAAGGVVLALLSNPAREWTVSELAAVSKVALGTAYNTVVALEEAGLLKRFGKGPATRRQVVDPAALLDRYAQDARADRKVAGRGVVLAGDPAATMREVADRVHEKAPGAAIQFTGTAAAQLLAPHVTAVTHYEAWLLTPHRTDYVLDAAGALGVEEGANLTLLRGSFAMLRAGSTFQGSIPLASVFRVYADALADPVRGEEVAEHLRATRIGF